MDPMVSRHNTVCCACFVVPRESSVNGCLIPPSLPCQSSPRLHSTSLHPHSPQAYLCDGQTWVAHVKVRFVFLSV